MKAPEIMKLQRKAMDELLDVQNIIKTLEAEPLCNQLRCRIALASTTQASQQMGLLLTPAAASQYAAEKQ